MKVFLKDGRVWDFKKDRNGCYMFRTRQNVYQLFFDDNTEMLELDIWIGRLYKAGEGLKDSFWYTCEDEIKADRIEFLRGEFKFIRRHYVRRKRNG